jgi:hypothetical protein
VSYCVDDDDAGSYEKEEEKAMNFFSLPTHKICLRPHKEKRYLSIVWMRHSWSFGVNFILCSYDIQKIRKKTFVDAVVVKVDDRPQAKLPISISRRRPLSNNVMYSMSMHVYDDKL